MYEFNKDDVFSFARTLGISTRQKGNELFFQYCPYCNGNHHDKETFSVNLDNGAFSCFRASCSQRGHFVELARDFNYPLNIANAKQYKLPPQNINSHPNDNIYKYFANRGISKEIIDRYNISASKDNQNQIIFPFKDENGIIQFYKVRNMAFRKGIDKCKEWSSKDCKPILFGMYQCTDYDTLIITEGQIDSLSISECGINNAVSVPTGALGFTWLKHCYDWILKFDKVIVFGDYENEKISLLEKLRSSLPMKVYSIRTEDYLHVKDANDILMNYGKSAIIKAIKNAEIQDVMHVVRLSTVKSISLANMEKIKSGIFEVDKLMGGFCLGQVTLLTGKRGEGKSTFGSQIIAEAIEQGYSTFIYSGELPNYFFKNWLDLQIAGGNHIKTKYNEYGSAEYYLEEDTIDIINKWYHDKAFIYDNSIIQNNEHSDLIKIITDSICRYDIKLVFIDNLMSALDTNPNSDLYRAQSEFVKALARIAKQYNVVIILVAHPKKIIGEFDNDAVSGSADITNSVDNIINYQRCKDKDINVDSKVTITKHRNTGKLLLKDDAILLSYSEKSKRIQSTQYFKKDKEYSCFLTVNSEDIEAPPF